MDPHVFIWTQHGLRILELSAVLELCQQINQVSGKDYSIGFKHSAFNLSQHIHTRVNTSSPARPASSDPS